ncbi:MAG: M28 family peptidase [Sedimentisphaerales bacterium]|nr:M28 family peptidase [Sedimentisphaerales bacterium]
MRRAKLYYINILVLTALITGCQSPANPQIKSIVHEVNEANLYKHISQLTSIGSRFTAFKNSTSMYITNKTAQTRKIEYISQCLEEYGYNVQQSSFNIVPILGNKGINLIAFKKGTTEPERVIELVAHYDTHATPGADDNCSGVAGLLETARILSSIETNRSIRFCFFDLEEVGYHLGSEYHVKLVKNKSFHSKDEIFDGAINLDMIAYTSNKKGSQKTPIRIPFIIDPPRKGNFILVVGNSKSSYIGRDFEKAIKTYASDLKYFSAKHIGGWFKDATRSDQNSYWNVGLPAIMITDTGEYRSKHYHQESDTIETLDFTFFSKVVQATVATTLEYAKPVVN